MGTHSPILECCKSPLINISIPQANPNPNCHFVPKLPLHSFGRLPERNLPIPPEFLHLVLQHFYLTLLEPVQIK